MEKTIDSNSSWQRKDGQIQRSWDNHELILLPYNTVACSKCLLHIYINEPDAFIIFIIAYSSYQLTNLLMHATLNTHVPPVRWPHAEFYRWLAYSIYILNVAKHARSSCVAELSFIVTIHFIHISLQLQQSLRAPSVFRRVSKGSLFLFIIERRLLQMNRECELGMKKLRLKTHYVIHQVSHLILLHDELHKVSTVKCYHDGGTARDRPKISNANHNGIWLKSHEL